MIDIHSHILFGVDDGSSSLEESLAALQLLIDNDVKQVVLTPHFMIGGYDNYQNKLLPYIQKLKQKAEHLPIKIHSAAEVYLSKTSYQDIIDNNFCINGGKYVLVETTMNGFDNDFYELSFNIAKNGLKPILAHPERYKNIIENPLLAEDLIHHNMYLQVNAGSLFGYYGNDIQKAAWELVYNGFVHIIASDYHCHNKPYMLKQAYDAIKEKIDDYTANLLFYENPLKVINSQPIQRFYLSFSQPKPNKKSFLSKIKKLIKI